MVAEAVRVEAQAVGDLIDRRPFENRRNRRSLDHVARMQDDCVGSGVSLARDGGSDVREAAQPALVRQQARVQVIEVQDRDLPDFCLPPGRN